MNNTIKAILLMLPWTAVMLYVISLDPKILVGFAVIFGGISALFMFMVGVGMLMNSKHKKDEVK